MSALYFESLKVTDIRQMYRTFEEAFSDYAVNFSMSKNEFSKKFVEKLNMDFKLSIGAFDDDRLVGFVYTSIAEYKGKRTAYNGGTGVIPSYRGQHIPAKIYELLMPQLKAQGIEQCVLEVITTNVKATEVYKKIGFVQSNYFHCFKLINPAKNVLPEKIEIIKISNSDWGKFKSFADFKPSFLDNDFLLKKNSENEQVIVALAEAKTIGYAIYQGHGRISQMGVDVQFRKQGVGSALVNFMFNDTGRRQLTILNIPKSEKGMLAFLKNVGFENQVDQFEMVLNLD